MTAASRNEHRVLILAPSGRDGVLAAQVLTQAEIAAEVCAGPDHLIGSIEKGAGAALVAEEALGQAVVARLGEALHRQPPWSDFPVIIFTTRSATAQQNQRALAAFAQLGNVTILERPVHPLTMVSGVRAALRARSRQYQTRAVLEERDREVRQRDQFLAMLGHELRNPLGVLRNASVLARRTEGQPGRAGRHIEIIDRQVTHLTHLVDDLLDVARVTSGKIALKLAPVDLVGLTKGIIEEAGREIRERRLAVEARLPDRPVMVMGDAVRIEQIVSNLLTNALKYTPAGGHIEVSVSLAGSGEATIAVTDTGMGIGADVLPSIFEPFTQAARTLDRSQGGMGLGLSVVRALARLHGGEVAASSEGLGRGSTFSVKLPLCSRAEIESTPPPAPFPGVGAGRHVLIVEDGADHRESLVELLHLFGHRADTASDGEQGIERALSLRPEVALVDIGLPKADGYEVARRVRAVLGGSVTLIAITGYGQPDDRARAIAAGFDAHLTKPVDPAVLERLLATLPQPVAAAPIG